MKSITLIGEAGCGKTEALSQLIPLLKNKLPHLTVEPLNDRKIYEIEVKKETAHLSGEKRIGPHSTGYYNEAGELTAFFVPDNEINRRVIRLLVSILDEVKNDPNRLLIVELGIGINKLADQSSDPYRWGLTDRLADARASGKALGEVSDIIVIAAPYHIRWERQQRRPDRTPEEAFTNYSGDGGLPENFTELLYTHGCNFSVIDNCHSDTELFGRQLVEAVVTIQPTLLEGKAFYYERPSSSRKEF